MVPFRPWQVPWQVRGKRGPRTWIMPMAFVNAVTYPKKKFFKFEKSCHGLQITMAGPWKTRTPNMDHAYGFRECCDVLGGKVFIIQV